MSEVDAFLSAVEPERRNREGHALNALFQEVTGWQPRFYTGGMVGCGRYDYTYASGHSGSSFATGFAPYLSGLPHQNGPEPVAGLSRQRLRQGVVRRFGRAFKRVEIHVNEAKAFFVPQRPFVIVQKGPEGVAR